MATSVTGRCVETRAVPNAGEQRDDNQQDHDEGDDPKHLHQRGVPLVEERSAPCRCRRLC